MKKFAVICLSLVLALSFAACTGPAKQINPGNSSKVENKKENIKGVKKDKDEEPEDEDYEEIEEIESSEDDNEQELADFEEIVVIDNDECAVVITGIDPEDTWGYVMKVRLENKSDEKTYMFSVDSAAINGVQYDAFFASEVLSGKKSNEEIYLSDEEFDKKGIGEYTDIELTFSVYDSDDWSADPVGEETINIYPYGEDAAVPFVREEQADDNVIIDNDSAAVIVTGYEVDEIWGYTVNLFLINKTDKTLEFNYDDVSVNGFMAEPYYYEEVSPGKCAFSAIQWSEETFDENGITDVEEIEGLFSIRDAEDFTSDDIVNETIILNP